MNRAIALIASTFAFSSAVAFANAGWDWDEEIQYRVWRTASLQWAHDIHPNHPTVSWLQANEAPPPREMWCAFQTTPTYADCEEHKARLEVWAEDFRGYYTPAEQLGWPRECPSSCYP